MPYEHEDLFAKQQEPPAEGEGGDIARPPERKAELRGLTERLQTLIQAISGKPRLEVSTELDPATAVRMALEGKNPEQTWFRMTKSDPTTRRVVREFVHVPARILESNEDVAKGKAAHEAGHVAITRFGEFVPERVLQETGFHGLLNAAEERPTDQVVRDRFEGAGQWVDEARRDGVREATYAVQGKERLGYIPTFGQLCDLIVYAQHRGDLPTAYDPKVLALYEKIRSEVEALEHTLPAAGASEKEVRRKAIERYKRVYQRIWPEARKLVAQDLEQEKLRQMIQQELANEQQKKGEGQEAEGGGEFGKEEAGGKKPGAAPGKEESERETPGEGGEGEGGEKTKPGEGEPSPLERLPEKLREELKKAVEDARREIEELAKGAAGEREEKPEGVAEGTPSGTPVPMDRLSQELRDALERAFVQLPKEQQEELRRLAREALEELEDRIVQEQSSELVDQPAETHAEHRERMEREERETTETAEERAERERIAGELKDIERHQAAIADSADEYEKTFQIVRPQIDALYRRLEEIFRPNIKRDVKLTSAGSRLNLPAVFRWEASRGAGAKATDNRIFERVRIPQQKDYAVTVLVDLSGSMRGKKIAETYKAAIVLAEVLHRLGVRNELLGFQDEIIGFKRFDEKLSETIRRKMSGMPKEVYDGNPSGHNKSSYNDDGPCLAEASRGLDEEKAREKFLLVLSDGVPEGRRSGAEDLRRTVAAILQKTDQKLVALGLGPNTEHVKKFYPVAMPNIDAEKLPETLGDLLEDIIRNPRTYESAVRKPGA